MSDTHARRGSLVGEDGLAAVLSGEAAELYERLVATGGLPLDEHSELSESAAAKDLVAEGFARERHVGVSVLVPVEPSLAVDNAILVLQRQILDLHQMLVRLRDEMQVLQRTYLSRTRAYEGPQELVRA